MLRVQVVKMLARLHHRMGAPEKAAEVLEAQVRDYPDATDLTHINILAELFMDADKFEQAAGLIRAAERLPCMQGGIPIDLTVKLSQFEVCSPGQGRLASSTHGTPEQEQPKS